MLDLVFQWLKTVILMAGYVSGSATFPKPLTPEEEEKYLKLYAEGDMQAKNILIEHNLRLVAHIAKKYSDEKNAEDIISIGTIGLIKGINTFSPDKKKKLSSYVSKCIENEVLMYLRASKKQHREVYIDDTLGTDSDGNTLTLADILPNDDPDISDKISDMLETKRLYRIMSQELTPTEYSIIVRRYGLGGTKRLTQQEIADSLGISRSYVSRIEKKCLIKLSQKLKSDN
ncbi:MAG: RNA polymerase sporulation sigma factor SigK [Clostridia bacterium]|jgi:RNA polymerase sporulation-specific sigma factor|nr:RNA polymerase sporulation sigma factor SigK [Clostridia bacterium]